MKRTGSCLLVCKNRHVQLERHAASLCWILENNLLYSLDIRWCNVQGPLVPSGSSNELLWMSSFKSIEMYFLTVLEARGSKSRSTCLVPHRGSEGEPIVDFSVLVSGSHGQPQVSLSLCFTWLSSLCPQIPPSFSYKDTSHCLQAPL